MNVLLACESNFRLWKVQFCFQYAGKENGLPGVTLHGEVISLSLFHLSVAMLLFLVSLATKVFSASLLMWQIT